MPRDQPNHIEVLPDGLNGIAAGLQLLREGKVSGAKLIACSQETEQVYMQVAAREDY